jgi:predicted nucleic acid-binding protein
MATMAVKGFKGALFLDTNTLVYANVIEAPFHEQALTAINAARQAGRTIWISRQVIREYLATLTRPQTFERVPKATVLAQVEQFIGQFEVADDTAAVPSNWSPCWKAILLAANKSMMPISSPPCWPTVYLAC